MKKKSKNNIKRTVTFLIILAIFVAFIAGSRIITVTVFSEEEADQQVATNYQIITSEISFSQLSTSTSKNIILFTSNWCGACSSIKAELKALATQFPEVNIFVADIESYRSFANEYDVAITPALVLIQKGSFTTIQEIRPENIDSEVKDFALLGI